MAVTLSDCGGSAYAAVQRDSVCLWYFPLRDSQICLPTITAVFSHGERERGVVERGEEVVQVDKCAAHAPVK